MYTLLCDEKELKEMYAVLCSFENLPSSLWNLQKRIGKLLTKKITVHELLTMKSRMKHLFLGTLIEKNEKLD